MANERLNHSDGGETINFTIAAGQSLSDVIELHGCVPVRMLTDANITPTALTFKTASTAAEIASLYDENGTEVSIVCAASHSISLGDKFRNFLGASFIQIRGGTSGTPVAQSTGSSTVLKVKVIPAG